jgi:soluble lytic murein transglycosylase-like protein
MLRTKFFLALAAVALLSASAPWHDLPAEYSRDPILQGPEAAADKTGAPAATIAGIRYAESSGRPEPRHPLATVKGAYGLDKRWHAYWARLYGPYDELDPYDAAYLTARLYMDHLRDLGNKDRAICAHLLGPSGARARLAPEYLARVRAAR